MKQKATHLPKDVTFVLDTSGSMADDNKLVQAKKALSFCLQNLNADDRFEIIRFSTEPEPLFGKLTDASDDAVAQAQKFVGKLKPSGGTAIFDALHQAMALRPEKSDRPYVVVFITDGMPTVGETGDDAIVAETDKAASTGTRVFCFGLGTDVNAHLLDRIAEHTRAVSDYILPNEDLEVKVSNFFAKIKEPVLANVKLTFPGGVKVTKMYPQEMPDLFQGDQLVLCGRYSGDGSGDCVIEGDAGGDHQTFHGAGEFPKTADQQPFVPRLWASRRVAYLLDEIRLHGENAELKNEATDLARQFGLVTPYTAYLIMEDERGRHVAEDNQVMRDMNQDEADKAAAGAYHSFGLDSSGISAVGAAKVSDGAEEIGTRSTDALRAGNLQKAAVAMNMPADPSKPASAAAPMGRHELQHDQRAFAGRQCARRAVHAAREVHRRPRLLPERQPVDRQQRLRAKQPERQARQVRLRRILRAAHAASRGARLARPRPERQTPARLERLRNLRRRLYRPELR